MVEGLSIDEAFLDVRGLGHILGTPLEIAAGCGPRSGARSGSPITVGLARTKFLAKVASAVAKPDGLLMVPAGRARVPAPVAGRAAVGRRPGDRGEAPRAGDHDRRRGRAAGRAGLPMLGPRVGRQLHALAHNRDPRPVRPRRRRRSIGARRAWGAGGDRRRRWRAR